MIDVDMRSSASNAPFWKSHRDSRQLPRSMATLSYDRRLRLEVMRRIRRTITIGFAA